MRSLVAAALLALSPALSAQDLAEPLAPYAALIGDWEGQAEATTPQGRLVLHQTERVRAGLQGHIITVEGTGRRLGDDGTPGEVAFNAYGVFSVDGASETVHFDAFTMEDRHMRVVPVATDDGFEWSITPEAGPRIHYVVRIDATGRWVETGAFSMDDGETWTPFFEMTLERVPEAAD